jgi:hypothetical protein
MLAGEPDGACRGGCPAGRAIQKFTPGLSGILTRAPPNSFTLASFWAMCSASLSVPQGC